MPNKLATTKKLVRSVPKVVTAIVSGKEQPFERSEEIIAKDLQRARESEARMQRMAVEERVRLYAMRTMGYTMLERTMKVVDQLSDAQLGEIARTAEGKNLASFMKSIADVIKTLPTASDKRSIEITKKITSLGDDELDKRRVELEIILKEKGLL